MKLNKYPYRIKIDDEIRSYIDYLSSNKIKSSHIIRESIRESLREKCVEFKYKKKEEYTPF